VIALPRKSKKSRKRKKARKKRKAKVSKRKIKGMPKAKKGQRFLVIKL